MRQDLHQLSGVYAVGALDEQERERFERHLRHCQACSNEVRGLREAATRMGLASAAQPPQLMREAVLGRAARTRQLPPVADPRRRRSRQTRPRGWQGGWMPPAAVGLAAACVAVIVVLAVSLASTQRQLSAVRGEQSAVTAVLSAPGARLASATTSVGGTTTVVVSWRLHKVIVTMAGLPALPTSRVYQLWVLSPAQARSAGLAGTAGSAPPVLASGVRRGDRIGVTVEPAGGTRQPTTKPIVVLPLPV